MVSEVTINIAPILEIILILIGIVGFITFLHKFFELNTLKKQLKENNQEIHQLNVKTEQLEENITKLTNIIEILQNKLNQDK